MTSINITEAVTRIYVQDYVSPSSPLEGISGAVLIANMFRDAIAGDDSLDILVVGDSNSLFYSGATGADVSGWTDGFTSGLYRLGAPIYATPIFPLYLDAASQNQGWRVVFSAFAGGIGGNGTTGDDGITTAYIRSGNLGTRSGGGGTVAGPSFCTDAFKISNGFGPAPNQMSSPANASTCDYAWFPSGEANRFNDYIAGINIAANSPLGISNAMKYRAVVARFASSGGEFTVRCDENGGSSLITDTAIPCTAAADEIVPVEVALNAGSRTGQVEWRWAGAFGARATKGVNGNFAGFLQSVYRPNTKGISVSCVAWYGGATMTQIATGSTNVGSGTLATWLKEARTRQISAGGSGRVVVLVHGGANADTGTPDSWLSAANTMKTNFSAAWSSLSYPTADLGFLLMTSHVKADPDDLANIRSLATTSYKDSSNSIFVDLGEIVPVAAMKTLTYYDNGSGGGDATPDVHMSPTGYEQVSMSVISRIIGYGL